MTAPPVEPSPHPGRTLTRRQLLGAGVSAAGFIGLAAAGCTPSFAQPGLLPYPAHDAPGDYRSRPDLHPPGIKVDGSPAPPGSDLVFVTQTRPIIVDLAGEPVWMRPKPTDGGTSSDLRAQSYQGRPVLTWWEGTITHGFGHGEGVMVDDHYREVTRVRAGNGQRADLHEFLLTERGTALITVYDTVPADLTSVGGPRDGLLLDSGFQEVDVASGRVLLEWWGRHHLELTESYRAMEDTGGKAPGYDHLHANGLAVDLDGDLLLSGRHTWTVYKIGRRDGAVRWRMGGKRSDFRIDERARFAWQHHITAHPDGSYTLFDNNAGPVKTGKESRGLHLKLDEGRRRVALLHQYRHPDPLLATSQGSMQLLPGGGAFVGWGELPYFSGFDADASWRYDGHLGEKDHSYRAFRGAWSGQPSEPPALAVRRTSQGTIEVAVSWNGATGVRSWTAYAGSGPAKLAPVGHAERAGFETRFPVATDEPYLAVAARDRRGTELGRSRAHKL